MEDQKCALLSVLLLASQPETQDKLACYLQVRNFLYFHWHLNRILAADVEITRGWEFASHIQNLIYTNPFSILDSSVHGRMSHES